MSFALKTKRIGWGNNTSGGGGGIYQLLSEKAQPNGYASLDSSGKVPQIQIPASAITDTFVVNSQAAMLALDAQTGDVCIRTDLNESFILQGSNPSILSNWQQLLTPTDTVLSVNGQIGAVILSATDVDALKRDGSNANSDVDIGNYSFNAKSFHVKGTGGAGHLGLKHQSANITATTNESSLGADSSGNPIWKNDGNTQQKLMLENSAITGATKTKITYDSKGLVTNGADATTADIADSTNKRYVTDAQLVVIGNTSGINTGDQILTGTYKSLQLSTNLTGGNTYYFGSLSAAASTTAANRRVVLGFGYTITTVSGFISCTSASGNNTLSIRVNNTTDYLVSNTFNINSNQFSFSITGLSIAIGANDYWEFKLVMTASVTAAVAEYNVRYTL